LAIVPQPPELGELLLIPSLLLGSLQTVAIKPFVEEDKGAAEAKLSNR
jgi:hypothetical protein